MPKRKRNASWSSAFINPDHPKFFLINDFFAILTILSVLSLVLETVPSLSQYNPIFNLIEWTSVALFSFEYIARLIGTKPSHKYIFSFFGIVDLVSIVPSFLGVGNLTFLKSARALRIIRLLRLIRTSTVKKHAGDESYNPIMLNMIIYFAALVLALLTFGTLMYLIEDAKYFASIPAGMWWSLKVFLGSIAVESPMTQLGEVLLVLTRFTGMLLLGLLLGVVGNIFRLIVGGK